jgi:hypothetical protein
MSLARASYKLRKEDNVMMDLRKRSLGWEMKRYSFITVAGVVS